MSVIEWYTVITVIFLYVLVKSARGGVAAHHSIYERWDFFILVLIAATWPVLPIGWLLSWILNILRKKHINDIIPDDESD